MNRPSRALGALLAVLLVAIGVAGSGQAAHTAVPASTTPPAITGTPTVGQTLTTSTGTWTNTPTSYAYQWLRCNASGSNCVAVANGTQKTYTLVGADAAHTMRARVTATNADGSTSAQSDQTATVVSSGGTGGGVPRATDRPIVSGTPTVGQMLETDNGTFTANPTSYTYQWQRCDADNIVACIDVAGATRQAYQLTLADVGYRLRSRVTAHNAKGMATATSSTTAVIAPKVRITNKRPSLSVLSVKFVGAAVYARFRVCDDSLKNLTIIATDSRPGKPSYTRRFTTLTAPRPCGVYTRHWTPIARFRGAGRFTVTLSARDKSGFTSPVSRRTFSHG